MLIRQMNKPVDEDPKKKLALEERIENNKKLIEKYPFLRPLDWRLGEIPDYDFTYTEIDNVPDGWRNLHLDDGRFYLDALKTAMVRDGIDIEKARVLQMKEKYGGFRIYLSGEGDETEKVLSEIERISERICCVCGAPATKISRGWICPYCDKCAEEESKLRDYPMQFVGIDEDPFKQMEEI